MTTATHLRLTSPRASRVASAALGLLAMSACALAFAPAALAQDEPDQDQYVAGGKAKKCTIVDADIKFLHYRIGRGNPQKEVLTNVQQIQVKWNPQLLIRGKNHLDEGRFDQAAKAFEEAAKDQSPRMTNYHKQDCLINQARALMFAGAGAQSVTTLKEGLAVLADLEKQFPSSRYIAEKYEMAGQALLQLASYDKAEQKKHIEQAQAEYGKLSTVSTKFSLDTLRYDIRGKYLSAQLTENMGKAADAATLYQQIWDAAKVEKDKPTPDTETYLTGLNAYSRLGVRALTDKNYISAKAIFENITKDDLATGDWLLGAAYRGLGDCYFQEKRYQEARSAYLRVTLVYKSSPELVAAVCGAIKCFEKIADTDWDARVKALKKILDEKGKKCDG